MTPEQVLDYYSNNGKRFGAQSRFARACNISPQYASLIIKSGEIPFNIQCELQVRTNGELKVDPELIRPDTCPQCGREIHEKSC